jgi:hypothetical protein
MVVSVFLDDIGEIMRLGLADVLAGVDVTIVDDLARADVALIDGDAADVAARAASLSVAFPPVTVIACSATRPVMAVVIDGADGSERPLTSGALLAAIRSAAATRWSERRGA